jgi:hypothetical protein
MEGQEASEKLIGKAEKEDLQREGSTVSFWRQFLCGGKGRKPESMIPENDDDRRIRERTRSKATNQKENERRKPTPSSAEQTGSQIARPNMEYDGAVLEANRMLTEIVEYQECL